MNQINRLPIQSFQKSEVSKMSWFTLEECIQVYKSIII